jgi:protein-S-isoprenylcysteine O-methyltransferase Ste14
VHLSKLLWEAAFWELNSCWLLFGAIILAYYIRVTRYRRQAATKEEPSLRASASMWGLALEGLAFAVVWVFRRPSPGQIAFPWTAAGMVLPPLSLILLTLALKYLGQQFRIQAVVAADHMLITSGPYRVVRHPVLASMLGMLISNAILISRWQATLCALAIYIAGTEIRVRAEDGLLARRFPDTFPPYRKRVRAYLPFLR